MSKIEPMTDTQIKTLLQPPHVLALQTKQIILAWIHAEARARKKNHWFLVFSHQRRKAPKDRDSWEGDDWITAVKKEVGWPEDL